jgi:predicted transposase/invertase (TIGR01784 family)
MTTEIDKIAQLDYAMEQGMEKGLKQGREEGLLLTAQNLKAEGISAEVICRATGLSQETVQALE